MVVPIVADPVRLRQVLATVIDDAVRHTEAGRMTVCEAMRFCLTLASTVGVDTRCIIDPDGRAPVASTVMRTVPETG